MPTYITLYSWTQQGIEKVKESPDRLESAKNLYREMGAEMKAFYIVMGKYDAVSIAEAPDDETIARISLAAASLGAIRSETLRAFTEAEYRKIISTLP